VSLVLDSSATLAWVYKDERSDAIAQVLDQVISMGAWVPSLWRLEVANVLEMSVRRGRVDAAFRDATLADLEFLPIQTDLDTEKHAWQATLRLAERHRLTLYDAAYLELAMRRRLPLATLDRQLRAAASAESVTLLGE
jgi:predicted nucleic acid-binding protein